MATITIPKKLTRGAELVVIPRKRYNEFLDLEKTMKKRLLEETDTDLAVNIYKKEKIKGKLRTIKSLADLD